MQPLHLRALTCLALALMLGLTACHQTTEEDPNWRFEPDETDIWNVNPGKPFQAGEIYEFAKPGMTYVWEMENRGNVSYRRTVFREVNRQNARIQETMLDHNQSVIAVPDGTANSNPRLSRPTWQELAAHGDISAEHRRRTTTIDTILGPMEVWEYEIGYSDPGDVSRLYFAKDMPGAPIRYEQFENGQMIVSMTLKEFFGGA